MKYAKSLIAALLSCVLLTATGAAAKSDGNGQTIMVGLWTKQTTIYISAAESFAFYDANSGKTVQKFAPDARVFIVLKNGKLTINDKPVGNKNLLIRTAGKAERGVQVNKKEYRGQVKVVNDGKGGLTVINVVPLEDYLYSVVPAEMPAGWAREAIKAQAVAARTFALYNLSLRKHTAEGYQLCATTHCQVYGGIAAEKTAATEAVKQTRGVAALYDNKPINAMFHSSAGGRTENSEDVWGSYLPYLRSVEDYDQDTPNYQWEKRFTTAEIQQKLTAAGYKLGKLRAVELSPLDLKKPAAGGRSKTGRVTKIRFIGDDGNVAVDGVKARSVLGLNSSLFDMELIVPNVSKIEVPIGVYYKDKIDVNVPPYKETVKWLGDKSNVRRLSGRDGEIIVVKGYGWGHGLGMSQWGAKVLAERADKNDKDYYQKIIKHYYKGVSLKRVY